MALLQLGITRRQEMDIKQAAKSLRKELKDRGYNNRQVSVTSKEHTTCDTMLVTVKSADVDYEQVSFVTSFYQSVSKDEAGEILLGGNRYATVRKRY